MKTLDENRANDFFEILHRERNEKTEHASRLANYSVSGKLPSIMAVALRAARDAEQVARFENDLAAQEYANNL